MVCWITTLLDKPPYELGTGHYLSSRGEGEGFSYVTMKFIWSLLKLCIIRLEEEGGGWEKRWILVATLKFTWSLLWFFCILMIPSHWQSIFFSRPPPPPHNTLLAKTPPCPLPRAINNYKSLCRYKSLIGQTTNLLESSLAQKEAQSSVQVHRAASRICCWVASENFMYYRM